MNRREFCLSATALLAAHGLRAQYPASWKQNHAPFRITGNLFYVGGADLASFLVATPEGLVLLNSNIPEDVPKIRGNVEKLGFRWKDVRILLISHAHADHAGGSAAIVRETGAKYAVMDGDVPVVESGGKADWAFGGKAENWYPPVKVDRVLHDGDEVRLGGAVLVAHKTAGHTKGTTSWTMQVQDGGRKWNAVILGSPNVLPQYRLKGDPRYPEQAADFEREFAVLEQLPCDLFLGSHAAMFGMEQKYRRMQADGANPFIDPAGYRAYVADRKSALEQALRQAR